MPAWIRNSECKLLLTKNCRNTREIALTSYNVIDAIAPRVIDTRLLKELYETPESREQLVKRIPIGRVGTPEDISELAVFLSGCGSSYITGQTFLVDGGQTL